MEVDGVVAEARRCLVTLATAALEGLAHADLGSVAILGVVLDTIHILVSLFAAWDRAGEGLLVAPVHAHGAEDGLGANGTFGGPGFVTVRLLVVHLLLVILATCRGTATEGGGGRDGRSDGRGQAATAVPGGRGHAVAGHAARQGQGQLGLDLLLQSLLLAPRGVGHKPVDVAEGHIGGLLQFLFF